MRAEPGTVVPFTVSLSRVIHNGDTARAEEAGARVRFRMRTPTLGIALAILALLFAPLGAAAEGLDVSVNAQLTKPDLAPEKEQSLPMATVNPPHLENIANGDLIEVSGFQAAAGNRQNGLGFKAEAGASARSPFAPERIMDTVVPAVENNAPAAAATVGVVALLQAFGVWRFLGLGAVGLYSRLTKSELLDNEHRDNVYKMIQEAPGMALSEVSHKSGLGWGTTVYHLDRLERAGFIASERLGMHKCYFPVGTVARETRKSIGALKTDMTRSIATFLVSSPGATQSDLCKALHLSPSAASKQVSKLEEAGLVRRERDWKTVHLYPQDALHALVAPPAATPATHVASPGVVLG